MRKDREGSGGPSVEFIGDDPQASAGDEGVAVARRARDRAVIAAGLLLAILVFVAVRHDHGTPTAAPKLSKPVQKLSSLPPREPPLETQLGTGFPGSPTVAIVKAFATHLPGSIVISEHTSLTNRGRELDARKIRAVTGNVTLDVVVSRPTGMLQTHVTRIMQGVYEVTIRSKGIYPPTRQQLHRLAADRRLTAVV